MSALRDALVDLPDSVFADVLESGDAYRVVLDLPGVTGEDLSVQARTGRVVVDAERDRTVPEGFEYVREERSDSVCLSLPLPPDASGAAASGRVERGVLTLTLPKTTGAPGTTIPIEDA